MARASSRKNPIDRKTVKEDLVRKPARSTVVEGLIKKYLEQKKKLETEMAKPKADREDKKVARLQEIVSNLTQTLRREGYSL